MRTLSNSRVIVAALSAFVMLACAEQSVTSPQNPLRDLVKTSTGGDTTNGVQTGNEQTPGYFHGTVRGQSQPGATDTMNTAPRLANVGVTVYSHVQPTPGADTLGVGPVVASLKTDANGDFQTPVLPGALYFIVFTPPTGSVYHGVWATAIAHSHSADYPWFIVLPK